MPFKIQIGPPQISIHQGASGDHEMRYGELAHFKLIPHTPYYGTADATPLYLIVLHAAWRATGDRALLERHLVRGLSAGAVKG